MRTLETPGITPKIGVETWNESENRYRNFWNGNPKHGRLYYTINTVWEILELYSNTVQKLLELDGITPVIVPCKMVRSIDYYYSYFTLRIDLPTFMNSCV